MFVGVAGEDTAGARSGRGARSESPATPYSGSYLNEMPRRTR